VDDVVVARALHVLAVVIWIGGVSMATTVVLPAVRHGDLGADRLRAFQAIERRFVWQARTAIIIVGATGLYIVIRADLWERFGFAEFWWMHAMICVWALFAVGLFVVEPFLLGRHFHQWAVNQPDRTFAWLQGAHWFLLAISLFTIFAAVAGSQGVSLL
jgi:uncharacterized membrane protein